MSNRDWIGIAVKPAVHAACLIPAAWVVWAAFNDGLGANPVEAINRFLGDWALRFLLIALAVTPLAKLGRMPWVMRLRRMIGLYAFFYVTLHLSSYIAIDQGFDWLAVWKDIVKRVYITVGMVVFVLLLPLALTSTRGWIKRLGNRRWKRLHWLVYPAAIGGVIHFYMMVKLDVREPLIYAAILALLLGWRAVVAWRKRHKKRKPGQGDPAPLLGDGQKV